jgi:hypothetical protein
VRVMSTRQEHDGQAFGHGHEPDSLVALACHGRAESRRAPRFSVVIAAHRANTTRLWASVPAASNPQLGPCASSGAISSLVHFVFVCVDAKSMCSRALTTLLAHVRSVSCKRTSSKNATRFLSVHLEGDKDLDRRKV